MNQSTIAAQADEEDSSPLTLPDDLDFNLPFFEYGAFKPNELAFSQVKDFLDLTHKPEAAYANGQLSVRDGLPLFEAQKEGFNSASTKGFILTFRPEACKQAYETICDFEPKAIYYWQDTPARLKDTKKLANILIGKQMKKGNPCRLEESEWSFRKDPVFDYGLGTVKETKDSLQKEYEDAISRGEDGFNWSRFFKMQMAYLLLWSAIERFASFAYGPRLAPMEKVRRLGNDPLFLNALERIAPVSDRIVSDSRDPGKRKSLNRAGANNAALFYYQVRCNLSHRGKGAWSDGDMVRNSLTELFAIFEEMLEKLRGGSAD